MSVQDIADQLKDRVAASGFDKSIKFDTGDTGVMIINGTSVTTEDGPPWPSMRATSMRRRCFVSTEARNRSISLPSGVRMKPQTMMTTAAAAPRPRSQRSRICKP